jgi:hypothetical protein
VRQAATSGRVLAFNEQAMSNSIRQQTMVPVDWREIDPVPSLATLTSLACIE